MKKPQPKQEEHSASDKEMRMKLKQMYEEKLKSFVIKDPETGKPVSFPVCFDARENCIRKPVPLEEIDSNIKRAVTCTVCDFTLSCSLGTLIDYADQSLMFQRIQKDKDDIIINLLAFMCGLHMNPHFTEFLRMHKVKVFPFHRFVSGRERTDEGFKSPMTIRQNAQSQSHSGGQ